MPFLFDQVYKLTLVANGKEEYAVVAMGVRTAPTALPGGRAGLCIAYIINSERPYRRAFGYIDREESGVIFFRQTDTEPEVFVVLTFEPLTLEHWKNMRERVFGWFNIPASSIDELRQWFWHTFVPLDWDDLPPDFSLWPT